MSNVGKNKAIALLFRQKFTDLFLQIFGTNLLHILFVWHKFVPHFVSVKFLEKARL